MRERLDALDRDDAMASRGENLEDDHRREEVLSSVFDTIIGRSKTYGHLLATVKRHYEGLLRRQHNGGGGGRKRNNNKGVGENKASKTPLSEARVSSADNELRQSDDDESQSSDATWKSKVGVYASKLSAAEAQVEVTVTKAQHAVKSAEQRAAIAKAAAAAAARAQVAAEAEAIRLTGENKRLRDEAQRHFAAIELAAAESEQTQLAYDSAVAAQDAAEAAVEELTKTCGTLEGLYGESQREVEELNVVLRARTQDITQLGQIIISLYKGEIQSDQLGEIASGIANIIGPPPPNASDNGDIVGQVDDQLRRAEDAAGDDSVPVDEAPPGVEQEEEDTSVPVDSAFYGVDAGEVTWEEPLSVRATRVRPTGMAPLALHKVAPPPDDPDAAMLEFAYEQQYGKEEAKRMIAEAKAAEAAK